MVEELSETSMEQISSQKGVHNEEKVKLTVCCKPSYQIRKLRNKGAIIILVWSFLVFSAYSYLEKATNVPYAKHNNIGKFAFGFTLPLAGWLADVYIGRYKVIRWSIWIMWIGSMLVTASSVVAQLVMNYKKINIIISFVIVLAIAIGLGGYLANIVQYGLDQLQDASTTEITAFIRWYVWSVFSSLAVFSFNTQACLQQHYLLGEILVCTCMTAAISAVFILDGELVREPTTQNPFKLIYKVIHYAIKHKHPQCRSAFTYCEDELPSRIDFGKSKYGGPFTTEQVEDVKTFLRLLVITTLASILASIIIAFHRLKYLLIKKFLHTQSNILMTECYRESYLTNTIGYSAVALLIPLYEFIIYPTIYRYIPSIKIYHKFILGVTLQIVTVSILMVFDSTAMKTHQGDNNNNSTIQCILSYDQGALNSNYNWKWITIAQLLETVSQAVLYISALEFLVSQTPYSMRGLMFGVGYGGILLFTFLGSLTFWFVTQQSSTWATAIFSCEFWYLFSLLLGLIIFSGLFLPVGRWYKNRKREDVLPNEHIFAERYYSRM